MIVAKSLAFDMSIEPTLSKKCRSFGKRQYDENDNGEQIQSHEESSRVNHFLVLVDMTTTSLKNRFEQFEVFESIVQFLFDATTLKSLDNDESKKIFNKL